MANLSDRVECKEMLDKVMPAEEAVKHITDRSTVAISGFTKSGEPKVLLPALARHFAQNAPSSRIALFSGASLAEEVENPIAPFVGKRGPYMSSTAARKLIHAGKMDFADVHLSQFARNLIYGLYGDVDVAVVEVSRVRPNGSVILSSSVGISAEALHLAKKVILEVNTAVPDYTGFHDIALPAVHPKVGWPIPITNVDDRVGTPYVEFDRARSWQSWSRTSRIIRWDSRRPPTLTARSPKTSWTSFSNAVPGSIGEKGSRRFNRGLAMWPTPSWASSTGPRSRRSGSGPRCFKTG